MDKFSDYPTTLTAPARDAVAVVPNDTTDLSVLPRALFIGQTGDVSAVLAGGQSLVFRKVQAGSILPVRAVRVNATGTTATDLVALW